MGKFIYFNFVVGQQVEGGEIIEFGVVGVVDVVFIYCIDIDIDCGDLEFMVGLVLINIGLCIIYINFVVWDFLFVNFGLGVVYMMELDEYNKLMLIVDVNKLMVFIFCQGDGCDEIGEIGIDDYWE